MVGALLLDHEKLEAARAGKIAGYSGTIDVVMPAVVVGDPVAEACK